MERYFYELFEALPRQGPGDDLSTEKAFRMLANLPQRPDILDVGCGSGTQTRVLAKLSGGTITALDNRAPILEILNRNIAGTEVAGNIHTVAGDMHKMGFAEESFDVIWAEGSSFIMGIEQALVAWRPLLRRNGYLAISDLVWFKKDVPEEIKNFFSAVDPNLKSYEDIFPVIDNAGYTLIDSFTLPDESWWTNYLYSCRRTVDQNEKQVQG